jgi:hypothetical protein
MQTHVLTQPTHEFRVFLVNKCLHMRVVCHLWLLLFPTIPYYTGQSTTRVNCLISTKSYHIE